MYLVAAAVAATAFQAYNQYQAGKAAQNSADAKAAALQIQANEYLQRAQQNIGLFREDVQKFKGTQKAVMGSSGFAAGTSELLLLEETSRLAVEEEGRMRKEAEWNASMIRIDAGNIASQGADAAKAARFDVASTLLGGAFKAYSASQGRGK